MKAQLHLKLFGVPQFIYQDIPITNFRTNKARALLIYLAVTGRPHSRDALADLLWADKPATGRENLKKVLNNLRKLDGVTLIEEGWHRVSLDLDNCWSDVAEFEQLAGEEEVTISATEKSDLQLAVHLYRDDFLAGFNTSLSHEFEEWALSEQAHLRGKMVDLLRQLAEVQAQQNQRPQAIATLRRLLHFEPWQEEIHHQLIELLACNNDAAAALAHYEDYRQDLRWELDVDPGPATLNLIAQIREGTLLPPPPGPSAKSQQAISSFTQKQAKTTVDYPLVGRSKEWQIIQEHWQTLSSSHFICIGGEAGIGKTRLAEELLMQAEADNALVARARSHELQGQLAYGPVTDWLRTAPLQAALAQLDDIWLTEIARLLPELLVDGLTPPEPLKEGWQRKRFFDALVHAFTLTNSTEVEGKQLLVLDDLQWSDSDTLEWLQYLLESTNSRLLIAGTVRLNEIDPDHLLHRVCQQLQRQDKFTGLHLTPLTVAATNQLATTVAEETLASKLTERLFQDTAGNPLFVIESMRAGPMDNGATEMHFSPYPQAEQADNSLSMPAKMYSVIQARLAQLSPQARQLAQLGATIGRSFDVTLLAKAAESDEDVVLMLLDELWQRRIIKEVDNIHFDFSHDRIRDVAYAEVGPIKRKVLHRKVVNALETIYEGNLDSVCGQLGVHCEAAGLFEQAIPFYQRAADVARDMFAHQDVVKYRRYELYALRELPRNTENKRVEIDLLLTLTDDLANANGKGSVAAGKALPCAHELAQDDGTCLQQFNVLNALIGYNRVRGQWSACQEFTPQLLTAAEKTDDPSLIAIAKFSLACTQMHQGYLEKAHSCFDEIQPYYCEVGAPVRRAGFLTRSAHCLWLLGFSDQARQRSTSILQWGRKIGQEALPMILHHYIMILVFCRDFPAIEELSMELVELTAERNDQTFSRFGKVYRGWILVHQGKFHEGIPLLLQYANEHRAHGNYLFECFLRSLLAEAYILASDIRAALTEINETLAYSQKSEDCYLNAQLLKLKGDCLEAQGASSGEVEEEYQLAIDTAREQKARSLELRASISLARLWQKQGKCIEAHQILAEIYDWFTEGFDTGDLIEAKALLADLAETSISSQRVE